MRELHIEILNAINSEDFDMLYFILENIIRNNNFDEIDFFMIQITRIAIEEKDYNNIELYNKYFDFFIEIINSVNLNIRLYGEYEGRYIKYTPALIYIKFILNAISGRPSIADDPEDYRPFIYALFNTNIDMDAGAVSINDLLEITEPGITNINWCKNMIRNMINEKFAEDNIYRQKKSVRSSLNPVLGMDSPLNYLDIDTMNKLYSSMKMPKPDISKKIIDEYTLDPLVKANQKLAFAKGFNDPNSSINIREDHLRDDISNFVSSMRPYPSVQKRYMLENKSKTNKSKTNKSKKFAKRTKKNRKKRNRY